MEFNTLLEVTWSDYSQEISNFIAADRKLLVTRLIYEGKTEESWTQVSLPDTLPFVVQRRFINTDAANEWIAGITAICQEYQLASPTFKIL